MSSTHHEGGGRVLSGAFRLKDYALAALAGTWLPGGMALLVTIYYIIMQTTSCYSSFPPYCGES